MNGTKLDMDSIHSIIPFLLYTKPDTSHAIFTLLIIIRVFQMKCSQN